MRFHLMFTAMLASFSAPVMAAGTLPIAQGLWADISQGCGRATGVTFYHDSFYGNIGPSGPGYQSWITINPIVSTGRGKSGFTNIWFSNSHGPDGDVMVKSLGADRFVARTISYGNGRLGDTMDVIDQTLVKCAFSQLPANVQAAVRKHRPQLAGATPLPALAAAVARPAPVPPLGIRPGHYVPVRAPCSTAVELVYYYDGTRAGWIDLTPFNPNAMDPVSRARKKGLAWDMGYGAMLRVDGPERITTTDPTTGSETMRWCGAHEVRASARAR